MSEPFVSFAQNAEDIVLWRALGDVANGCYVDVGAADPVLHSVTKAFYERGWRGVNVEPVPELADALRRDRPEDITVSDAAGATAQADRSFFVVEATGLSTLLAEEAGRSTELGYASTEVSVAVGTLDDILVGAGLDGRDIHFCKIDVEGAEAEVLAGFDLRRWRPWVLVVEATRPLSTESTHGEWEPGVLESGYELCLFDGLNRFYVAEERAERAARLAVPANATDPWLRRDAELLAVEDHTVRTEARARHAEAEAARVGELAAASAQVATDSLRWRRRALDQQVATDQVDRQLRLVNAEMDATVHTLSWRVTGPVRRVRRLLDDARSSTALSTGGARLARARLAPARQAGASLADRARGRRPGSAVVGPDDAAAAGAMDAASLTDAFVRRLAVVADLAGGSLLGPHRGVASDVTQAVARFEAAATASGLAAPTLAWLARVAVSGSYPDEAELDLTTQLLQLDGPSGLSGCVVDAWRAALDEGRASGAQLGVLDGGVAVDVTHTASWDLHTGVQRVTRETAARWAERHDAVLFAWDYPRGAPLALTGVEVARFGAWRERVGNDTTLRHDPVADTTTVLVPWRSTVVVPELPAEAARADRYRALARSGILRRLAGVGYDMIPVTANETLAGGMSDVFSDLLGVVKHMDRLSGISASSAAEFAAFAEMLGAQGLTGPVVAAHLLPTEVPEVTAAALERVRAQLALDHLPMVLVVGSHEPRKNHLTVLVAAERLWRAGHAFHLVFIGGSGWSGERFDGLVGQLRGAGRPIQVIKVADEELLWAAYRLARFTVFPSLTEGYGLPVAESLASGTPAITSDFGSMAEIAADGGAVLVDPRDVDQVEQAMGRLLTDHDLLDQLRTQARDRTWKTWDDYAEETWAHLVD